MPEPVLGETVTDIDAIEAGELEFDLTGAALTVGRTWRSSVEAEWRALPRIGFALEASTAGDFYTGLAAQGAFGLRVAGAFSLLHDPSRDFHLQAEVAGRLLPSEGGGDLLEPGDSALPLQVGLRAGVRRGRWTVRAGLGADALGHSAHLLPVWASVAGLVGLGKGGSAGFCGVEVSADWGNVAPFLFAPTAVASIPGVPVPVRLGLALPMAPGHGGSPFLFSAVLRLMVESDLD